MTSHFESLHQFWLCHKQHVYIGDLLKYHIATYGRILYFIEFWFNYVSMNKNIFFTESRQAFCIFFCTESGSSPPRLFRKVFYNIHGMAQEQFLNICTILEFTRTVTLHLSWTFLEPKVCYLAKSFAFFLCTFKPF